MAAFLDLLMQAADLVEKAYPSSKFYEADGRPSSGAASDEGGVDTWRFVFLGPVIKGGTTSVFLTYQGGSFGQPVLKTEPFLGDHVITPPHWPIRMSLAKAIELRRKAGFTSPFKTVTLRWPLSPENKEPLYIFRESDGSFVFVGTESGTVTRTGQALSDFSLQTQPADGSEQIRLCTARGLAYKAYRRPYSAGTYVLTLLASGYYEVAPWDLQFVSDGGKPNKYKLMEKVPMIFHHLRTYYSPCSCSHYGVENLGDTVTIEDSFGEHQVRVENFGE